MSSWEVKLFKPFTIFIYRTISCHWPQINESFINKIECFMEWGVKVVRQPKSIFFLVNALSIQKLNKNRFLFFCLPNISIADAPGFWMIFIKL